PTNFATSSTPSRSSPLRIAPRPRESTGGKAMNEPQRHRDTENEERDPLTRQIIGAAIDVHRILGPGLPEALYEKALCIELDARGLKYARQLGVPVYYKERLL